MTDIIVNYGINRLAGTGKILLEQKSATIQTDCDLNDETTLHKLAKTKISSIERVPESEIKILGFMTVNI
jgi:carbamoylphosphate synthase large subunit